MDRVHGFIIMEPSPQVINQLSWHDHSTTLFFPYFLLGNEMNAADLAFLRVHPEAPQADSKQVVAIPLTTDRSSTAR